MENDYTPRPHLPLPPRWTFGDRGMLSPSRTSGRTYAVC